MRDFLVWYNNRDVVTFLEAIDKQFAFYKKQNINMFKEGVNVPGLALLYLFNKLPNNLFTVFNQTNNDLHLLVKEISSVVRPSYFTATMRRTSPIYEAKRHVD